MGQDEFHGPGALVAGGLGRLHRRLPHGPAQVVAQGPGGGLLDELLVLPLDGAVPLPQVDHIPLAVGQDLELDVPGVEDELLHIELPVPEAGHGLRLGGRVKDGQVLRGVYPAHTAPASAGAGLQEDGISDFFRDLGGLLRAGDRPLRAGDHGDAMGAHQGPGGRLVAHLPDDVAGRADELQPALPAQVGKLRILREKAIARMDGVTARLQGGGEEGGHVEVAVRRLGRADAHGLGGQLHMEGVGVGGGVDRHRLYLQLPAGTDDPHRDLAPVGDQDTMEHSVTAPSPGRAGHRSPSAPRPWPGPPG